MFIENQNFRKHTTPKEPNIGANVSFSTNMQFRRNYV